jgi:hypothetical protein
MTKFEKFMEELDALCARHKVGIELSRDSPAIEIWDDNRPLSWRADYEDFTVDTPPAPADPSDSSQLASATAYCAACPHRLGTAE